ncbi:MULTISPECIES: DUF6615 family protein [Sphingomonas]|uniref:DUF6615 family protein n=1 Tax=Sphingomonas TaxID=13687 RepID=UPI000DF00123|nr:MULTISPECIES: DUF6615 family protein [Sphingomonas]
MPVTLCDLAAKLPLVIGRFLDRERLLQRGRFGETTMTDIFTTALTAFAGPELLIEYPPETETGGDVDLVFANLRSGWSLNARLQAKRLSAERQAGKPVKIEHRNFSELLHKPKRATQYQYQTLVNAPDPWIPLYMLYNHHSVAGHAHFATAGPKVSGVNLAFAFDIADELDAKVSAAATKPKKILHHKRLSHLRPHLFGLDVILCPAGNWDRSSVPPPEAVAESLLRQWNIAGEHELRTEDVDTVLRKLLQPARLTGGRQEEQLFTDGPSVRINERLQRPRITLLSGRTADDNGPVINDNDGRDPQ